MTGYLTEMKMHKAVRAEPVNSSGKNSMKDLAIFASPNLTAVIILYIKPASNR